VGILLNLSPQVQLGASYRSKVDLDLSGTTDFDVYWPYNPGIIAQDSSMLPYFSGGVGRSEFSTDMTLKLPANFGAGIVYRQSEKLLFTLDVEQTQWSSMDEFLFKYANGTYLGRPFLSLVFPQKWENTTKVSVGSEYVATDRLTLRGGAYRDPSPIPNSTFSPLIPDLGDKTGLSFGLSYKTGKFELSYAYEFLIFANRIVDKLEDLNQDGQYDNFPGTYTNRTHTSYLSLSYRF
jgi:long-chain fatty acid transport protein